MNYFISAAAGFGAGILGSMGLGGGGILIIYLSLFSKLEQMNAQGINLIFFVSIALISVIFFSFKNLIDWKFIFPAVLLGIPGTFIGFHLSSNIDAQVLSKIFSVFLICIGIYQLFPKKFFHI